MKKLQVGIIIPKEASVHFREITPDGTIVFDVTGYNEDGTTFQVGHVDYNKDFAHQNPIIGPIKVSFNMPITGDWEIVGAVLSEVLHNPKYAGYRY